MAWRRAQFARRHAIVISAASRSGATTPVEYEREVTQGA
jgi:hypothetical protein